ncbi:MAG: AMP-binding protein [Alphaproteobacteria bacterium]|nr:AMP-binding protein [Alphaproteobacteria bacterium]
MKSPLNHNGKTDESLSATLTTQSFKRFADRTAFIYDKNAVSYHQLSDMLMEVSEQLVHKNLQSGDHLLIYSPDPQLIASVFLGALRAKIIPGIIPVGLNEQQLNMVLSEAKAKLILCDRNFATQFRGIEKYGTKFLYRLPTLDDKNTNQKQYVWGKSFLVFAGATCEYPHCLISSSRFLEPIAQAEQNRFNLTIDDKIFCAAGLSGVAALVNGFLCPLLYGMTTIFANIWTSPRKLTDMMSEYQPRLIIANLSQYQAMMKNIAPNLLKDALRHTNYCIAVGEAMNKQTADEWHELTGLQLIEQPILLTGSRHANDLAYAAANDSYSTDLLKQNQQTSVWRKLFKVKN